MKERITRNHLYKSAVPTVEELRLLLKITRKDYEREDLHLLFLLIAVEGMRIQEAIRLTWKNFTYLDGKFTEITYQTFKPRRIERAKSITTYFKVIKKPIYSTLLNDELLHYHDLVSRHYCSDRLFAFQSSEAVEKYFARLRRRIIKENLKEWQCFLDVTTDGSTQIHRITGYSLRRFSFTFHYWTTYKERLLSLSRDFGHTKPETTWDHYLHDYKAIGLTEKQISMRIDFDAFFQESSQKTTLAAFLARPEQEISSPLALTFTDPCQKTLVNYL